MCIEYSITYLSKMTEKQFQFFPLRSFVTVHVVVLFFTMQSWDFLSKVKVYSHSDERIIPEIPYKSVIPEQAFRMRPNV